MDLKNYIVSKSDVLVKLAVSAAIVLSIAAVSSLFIIGFLLAMEYFL